MLFYRSLILNSLLRKSFILERIKTTKCEISNQCLLCRMPQIVLLLSLSIDHTNVNEATKQSNTAWKYPATGYKERIIVHINA